MNKWERKQMRKKRNKFIADEVRKVKVSDDEVKHKEKWWKLNDGGVASGNNFKIGRTGLYAFAGVGAIIALFAYGLVYETDDTPPPAEISFEACEATDFADTMCKYYYKFCRTYADEGVVCQYAETNPWTDIDVTETKWQEGEQDFLPPTADERYMYEEDMCASPYCIWTKKISDFFFPEAEARGEDEPTCYSQTCKKNYVEEKKTPGTISQEDVNEDIIQLKIDMKQIELDIKKLEQEIPVIQRRIVDIENNIWTIEDDLDDLKDKKNELKKEYKDRANNIQTAEDIADVKQLRNEYNNKVHAITTMETAYERAMDLRDDQIQKENDTRKLIIEKEELLEQYLLDMTELKLTMHKVTRNNNFISISLSQTCQLQHEYGSKTDCPTYRELRDEFDNTQAGLSGDWIDMGYDIKREASKLDQYWRVYQSIPNWKVITVDPDYQMYQRSMSIEIQPRNFYVTDTMGSTDKTKSYGKFNNSTETYVRIHEGIVVYEECRKAIVEPDMDSIRELVSYFASNCMVDKKTWEQQLIGLVHVNMNDVKEQTLDGFYDWWSAAVREYRFAK